MHGQRFASRLFLTIFGLSVCFNATLGEAAEVIQAVGGAGASQVTGGKSGSGKNQFMLGATTIYFTSSASQAGQDLPGGTTTYRQFNLQYNLVDYLSGIGLFYQNDLIGSTQSTTGMGLKVELTWKGYYIEGGLGLAEQHFSERAVTTRSGTQYMYGGGIRVPFLQELFYFDGGIRKRASTYTKQDGIKMSHPLHETLSMPFIGFGVSI